MYASFNMLGNNEETKTKAEAVTVEPAKLREIIRSTRLVCVDFYADWCGPCKSTAPDFARVSNYFNNNFPSCAVFKCNYQKLSEEDHQMYKVAGLPTFVFFVDGREIHRIVGADINGVENKLKELTSQYFDNSNIVRDLTNTVGPVYSKNSIRNLRPNPDNQYM